MSRKNISEQRKESIKRIQWPDNFYAFFPSRYRDSYLKTLFTRCGYQTCSVPLGLLCEEKMSKEAIFSGK